MSNDDIYDTNLPLDFFLPLLTDPEGSPHIIIFIIKL